MNLYDELARTSALLPTLPTSLKVLGTHIALIPIDKSKLEELTNRDNAELIIIPDEIKKRQRENFWYARVAAIGPQSLSTLLSERIGIGDIVVINKKVHGHEINIDGIGFIILHDAAEIEMKVELENPKGVAQ